MNEFCSSAELNAGDQIYPTLANTTELFNKDLEVVGEGYYPIILNAPYRGRISSFNIKADSGTGTFTVKINGVNVTGLVAKTVSSDEADYEPTDLNAFDVDQDIYIDVTSANLLLGVSVTIEVLRDVGTASVVTEDVTSGTTISAAYLERVSIALPQGFSVVDIPFGVTKLDSSGSPTANYSVSWEIPENFTDTIVERIYPTTVLARTSTKLTVLLNATPTTSNTIVRATIATDGAAQSIIAGGSTFVGSDVSVATTSFPLRGDGAGNAIAVSRQTGDAATGLAALNLFSSTPTYDATKLTGTVSVNRFDNGAGASAATFLDGSGHWTTPSGSGGNVALDPIFDARGDLPVGTGANTSAKLSVGAPDTLLVSLGGLTPTGLGWIKIGAPNINSTYIDGAAATASLRTLGTGASQAAAGNDIRITGALQASNSLSEISTLGTFDEVRTNLNFGTIVYENLPDGGPVGLSAFQEITNKVINGALNTLSNIPVSAIAGSAASTLTLTDPNADRILFWDDSAGVFDWLPPDTGWTAMTGTGSKGALAAAAAGTASAGYVQAELQAALNRIAALEARLKSYDAILFTNKIISA